MIYKIMNNLSPDYLKEFAQRIIPNRDNLRSRNDCLALELPQNRKCLQFDMVTDWNSLSFELRASNSVEHFKKDLKTTYFRIAYGGSST